MPRKPTDVALWLAEDPRPSPGSPGRLRTIPGALGWLCWAVGMAALIGGSWSCATPYEPPQPCDKEPTNWTTASDSLTVVGSALCIGHWR